MYSLEFIRCVAQNQNGVYSQWSPCQSTCIRTNCVSEPQPWRQITFIRYFLCLPVNSGGEVLCRSDGDPARSPPPLQTPPLILCRNALLLLFCGFVHQSSPPFLFRHCLWIQRFSNPFRKSTRGDVFCDARCESSSPGAPSCGGIWQSNCHLTGTLLSDDVSAETVNEGTQWKWLCVTGNRSGWVVQWTVKKKKLHKDQKKGENRSMKCTWITNRFTHENV